MLLGAETFVTFAGTEIFLVTFEGAEIFVAFDTAVTFVTFRVVSFAACVAFAVVALVPFCVLFVVELAAVLFV